MKTETLGSIFFILRKRPGIRTGHPRLAKEEMNDAAKGGLIPGAFNENQQTDRPIQIGLRSCLHEFASTLPNTFGERRSRPCTRSCSHYWGGRRRESIFSSSKSDERWIPDVFEREATLKSGKSTPARRVAVQIGPYFVVVPAWE